MWDLILNIVGEELISGIVTLSDGSVIQLNAYTQAFYISLIICVFFAFCGFVFSLFALLTENIRR